MGQPSGYLLLEIMVLLAVSGLLISGIIALNQTLLTTWHYTQSWASLQQVVRISMNSIIERLQSAIKLQVAAKNKIIFWSPQGNSRQIFYQPGEGLCIDDESNKISHRITEVKFARRGDDLLLIQIAARQQAKTWRLKTALSLEADQFVSKKANQ